MAFTHKPRVYIYPITARGGDESSNPYISNLTDSLLGSYEVVNQYNPSSNGILQLYNYFFKTDIVYFNWVENLPDRKGGAIQTLLLVKLIFLYKLFGKKVVWTMHNKISHTKSNFWLKSFVFRFLVLFSDLVITHSEEGVKLGKSIVPKCKICYFPHPVLQSEIQVFQHHEKKYDILIWGVMAPYKGLSKYLKYLKDNKIDKFRILIAGKFVSDNYYAEVLSYKTENIEVLNQFIEKHELDKYIGQTAITVFTYQDSSVLSSGVLMDTLCRKATIVGPNTGSFKDLAVKNLVFGYTGFDQLTEISEDILAKRRNIHPEDIDVFLNTITWIQFAEFFKIQIAI